MPQTEFARLSALLDTLLALPDHERQKRLQDLEQDAPADARYVRQWLGAIDASNTFMASSVMQPKPLLQEYQQVGPWRPITRLGRGGMGEVWLGERADGAFERKVAIKFLLNDDARLKVSLAEERRLLASLDHPGIARLLDGGVTDDGYPYLVTEYVDGAPIDTWCQTHRATITTRLDLFRQVCDAVAHAHGQLIVHRDIKPANILVDGQGRTKLLDFGIARLLNQDAPQQTIFSALTPDFAAPEQLGKGHSSVRTDVYSLGALLYLLLTNTTPLVTQELPLALLIQRIKHDRPIAPSQRTGSLLTSGRTLSKDLDAIVLKALAKQPNDRYQTVEALLADIDNALHYRRVRARSSGRWEQFRRYAHRHWINISVTGLLAIGLGTSVVQTWRAEQATQRAELEASTAKATNDFLVEIFESASPYHSPGAPPTAVDLVDVSMQRANIGLETQPALQAQLLGTLAVINAELGRSTQAAAAWERARAIAAEGQSGEFSPIGIQLTLNAALLTAKYIPVNTSKEVLTADLDRVIEYLRKSKDRVAPQQLVLALIYRAALLRENPDVTQAETLVVEAIKRAQTLGPQHARELAMALHVQGEVYQMANRPRDAIAPLREALAIRERILDPRSPHTIATAIDLAYCLAVTGNGAEAEQRLRALAKANQQALGEYHPDYAHTLLSLATVLMINSNVDEAERLLTQALNIADRSTGRQSRLAADILNAMAHARYRKDDLENAARLIHEQLAIKEKLPGNKNDLESSFVTLDNLAVLDLQNGEFAKAERQLRDSLSRRQAANAANTASVLNHLGWSVRMQGRAEEAKRLQEEALIKAEQLYGENGIITAAILIGLGTTDRDLGNNDNVRQWAARAERIIIKQMGESPEPQYLRSVRYLQAQVDVIDQRCNSTSRDVLERMRVARLQDPNPRRTWQVDEADLLIDLCQRQMKSSDITAVQERKARTQAKKLLASPYADPFAKRIARQILSRS